MQSKDFTVIEENGKEVLLSIKIPEYEDIEESDRVYAAKVSELIKESTNKRKILLRRDLDKFLKDGGFWTDEDEKNIDGLQRDIDILLTKMKKGGSKLSDGRKWAIQTMDKRREIVRIMDKKRLFDDSTVEAMAENEKNDYLIYCSTVYVSNGDRYWMSFEDMKNDKLSNTYRKASVAAYEVFYNINPELEKNLPENKWLKRYGFIDDDLNYVDRKTKKIVDKNGQPVEEIKKAIEKQYENLQGDIIEDSPYIDDETNEPVVVEQKEESIPSEDVEKIEETTTTA